MILFGKCYVCEVIYKRRSSLDSFNKIANKYFKTLSNDYLS